MSNSGNNRLQGYKNRINMLRIRCSKWLSCFPPYMFLALPYHQLRKFITYEKYIRSEDSKKLRAMKDIHPGKRCFVIGNGPSLTGKDLDKLKDEYTFAANRIYDIFDQTDWRPTYYTSIDRHFLAENHEIINTYPLGTKFLSVHDNTSALLNDDYIRILVMNKKAALKYYDFKGIHISEDVSKYISNANTVTFASIQLAIYMGFTEIYLLGVDFSYSVVRDKSGKVHRDDSVKDYFSGKRYDTTELYYEPVITGYIKAKEYCEEHGIAIKNATRGGKLEVFQRVDLDSLFEAQPLIDNSTDDTGGYLKLKVFSVSALLYDDDHCTEDAMAA